MKKGDYIHMVDDFGVLNGIIDSVIDYDNCYVRVISSSIDAKWQYDKNEILMVDMSKAHIKEIYENFEELVEAHFEDFL